MNEIQTALKDLADIVISDNCAYHTYSNQELEELVINGSGKAPMILKARRALDLIAAADQADMMLGKKP